MSSESAIASSETANRNPEVLFNTNQLDDQSKAAFQGMMAGVPMDTNIDPYQMTPEQAAWYQQYYSYYMMAYAAQQQQVQTSNMQSSSYEPENFDHLVESNSDPNASRSVWVGNIPSQTTEADIREAFGPYGEIEQVKFVTGKNCCFVIYNKLGSALASHLYRPRVKEQPVKLGWGKIDEKEDMQPVQTSRTLYIGNLPPDASDEEIISFFSQHYPVRHLHALREKKCAFVEYDSIEVATKVKQLMNGLPFKGVVCRLNYGKYTEPEHGIGLVNAPPLPSALLAKGSVPPPFAPPPESAEKKDVIDRFASFVIKNGSSFETMFVEKVNENPKMAFLLSDDPDYDYYLWKVYELFARQHGLTYQSAPSALAPNVSTVSVPPRAELSPELTVAVAALVSQAQSPLSRTVALEFAAILMKLECTVDPIKFAKDWILSHEDDLNLIISIIKTCLTHAATFINKLAILYLCNDVFIHGTVLRSSNDDADAFSSAFKSHLNDIVSIVARGATAQEVAQVFDVLVVWREKLIFSDSVLDPIEEMLNKLNTRKRLWDVVGDPNDEESAKRFK